MVKQKKFKVISIHPYTSCNLSCPFCYKAKSDKSMEKPEKFWYDLIPYISKYTDQIACGGGEPWMNKEFIKNMARKSKQQGLLFNVTSNGRLLMGMSDKELKEVLKDITMVSLSFDDYKVATKKDLNNYLNLVKRIKGITGCQIGANLLVSDNLLSGRGRKLIETVDLLFRTGVDRVFALYPKNMPNKEDILRFRLVYNILTMKYKNFYVDDCTKMILQENSYHKWKNSCHYGKDLISINELGFITGCSFDPNNKAVLKINTPKDLLKLNKVKMVERFDCPFITRK